VNNEQFCCLLLLQVSLFAELINEMLIRDFAFCVYNALLACPDKARDNVKRDDGRKKGSDKRADSQKRDEKKSDKDNVDQRDKDSSEVKKETKKDRDRDVDVSEVHR